MIHCTKASGGSIMSKNGKKANNVENIKINHEKNVKKNINYIIGIYCETILPISQKSADFPYNNF